MWQHLNRLRKVMRVRKGTIIICFGDNLTFTGYLNMFYPSHVNDNEAKS